MDSSRTSSEIRFLDMFAGIGGFRSGLYRAGGFHCVGFCEIDPYAKQAYQAIYDTEGELYFNDARTIDPAALPDLDLICGGFPCQTFSAAGRRQGFSDPRGTLFFEIARIAAAKRPPYLLLENVPGLLSHDEGRTFATILHSLDELGYDVAWQVCNSRDFGVPQVRKRLYLIGYLRERCAGELFSFPAFAEPVDPPADGQGIPIKVATNSGFQMGYAGDSIDLSYLTMNSRRGRVGRRVAHTLTTSCTQGVILPNLRIRRMTPLEYWRLQGFTDEQFRRARDSGLSDTRLYKMAGNAVSVPVIAAIGQKIREHNEHYKIITNP